MYTIWQPCLESNSTFKLLISNFLTNRDKSIPDSAIYQTSAGICSAVELSSKIAFEIENITIYANKTQ
jgi:hypothetical protein